MSPLEMTNFLAVNGRKEDNEKASPDLKPVVGCLGGCLVIVVLVAGFVISGLLDVFGFFGGLALDASGLSEGALREADRKEGFIFKMTLWIAAFMTLVLLVFLWAVPGRRK